MILHTLFAAASLSSASLQEAGMAIAGRNAFLFAVPAFVMVTGALLLNPQKEITYRKLFGYIAKTLFAIVAMTVIYEAFDIYVLGNIPREPFALSYFRKLYTDGSWSHVWYLYMLTGIYLILPLYKRAAAGMDRRDFRYLLAVFFAFQSLLPFVQNLMGLRTGFYIGVYTIYPFYLLLGYAMHRDYIHLNLAASILLFVLSTAGIAGMTWAGYIPAGGIQGVEYIDYSFPLVILQSMSFFGIIKGIWAKRTRANRLFMWMDYCSFGVYLLHMIAIKAAFGYFKVDPWAENPALLAGVCAAAYLASCILTWVYKKIA